MNLRQIKKVLKKHGYNSFRKLNDGGILVQNKVLIYFDYNKKLVSLVYHWTNWLYCEERDEEYTQDEIGGCDYDLNSNFDNFMRHVFSALNDPDTSHIYVYNNSLI